MNKLKQAYLSLMENLCEHNNEKVTAAIVPLAQSPPVERHVCPYETPKVDVTNMTRPKTNVDITKAKKIAQSINDDYGRQILITIADITQDEITIRKEIKDILYSHVRNMLIVPDYSPVDGRLHYHGVLNVQSPREFGKALAKLRKYIGNTWVKIPKRTKNMDYLFKIYERNTKTPPNTILEAITLKQIIMKYNQ